MSLLRSKLKIFTDSILLVPDRSRARVVNLLLLPLLTFLYYINFICPISEKKIMSVLLTNMTVCLLTYHRVSAIHSLTTFRKTAECKHLSEPTRWLLDFWDGQHMLSFALELIVLSDYWLLYIGDEFYLVVFTTVGLIITVLIKTLLLLITSMDSVMDPHNPIFAYVNLHKLFYIPIIWLVLFSVNYDETFVFERGPTHFYVLITIIWYPAVSL